MPFKPMQYLAPCKILRISESEKRLLVKFGILRFGIRNLAQGIRNSATLGIWNLSCIDSRNLESKLYWLQESGIQDLESRIQAWESRRHFATPPLVSQRNDVWEKSTEIPYWWRVTTQIWVITRRHYRICALVSQTSFRGEISGSVAKRRLISQATRIQDCLGWTHLERNIWPSVIHT